MRKIALIFISLISAISAFAEEPLTAVKVFAEAPLEVLDMIRPSSRLDMIDYYTQADSLVGVPNALGGQSRLLQVADDYMKVTVTPSSTLEIKILPYKKSRIAMTLYTVGNDSIARDTDVRFFDSDLQQLPTEKFLAWPDAGSFFNLKGSDVTAADFREWLPFHTYFLTTGPGESPLIMSLTTLRTLPTERREALALLLIPAHTLTWTGSKFK